MVKLLRLLIVALALLPALTQAHEATPETNPEAAVTEAVEAATHTGPREVIVGVYVNDIQQLDLQTHSYVMDFYVWLRWTDPDANP